MNSPPVLPGSTGQAATPSTTIVFAIAPADPVTFDGDSVTAGWDNATAGPDSTFSWTVPFISAVNAAYAAAGKTAPVFTNVAVGGRTSTATAANVATATATKPYHIFLLSSVNDQADSVSPTTTYNNYLTYFAAVLAACPGCRIWVISNNWGSVENWPRGAGPDDSGIDATNAAIVSAVATCPFATYINTVGPIYTIDEPAQNPTNLATGVLVQSMGGDHPTKPAGQNAITNVVLANVTLVFT